MRKSRTPVRHNRALAQKNKLSVHPRFRDSVLLAPTAPRRLHAWIARFKPGPVGIDAREGWRAVAGAFVANLGETMPREASPCGTVLAQDSVLLFDRAERHFPALRGVQPPIFENLLVPFHLEGRPVETVWAIAHRPERKFDGEDARLLSS